MLYTDQEVCYKIFMIHIFLQDTLLLKHPTLVYTEIFIFTYI